MLVQFLFHEEVGLLSSTIKLMIMMNLCLKSTTIRKSLDNLMDHYVNDMIREIKVNKKLNDAGWDNQVVFVDRIEQTPDYFESAVF